MCNTEESSLSLSLYLHISKSLFSNFVFISFKFSFLINMKKYFSSSSVPEIFIYLSF